MNLTVNFNKSVSCIRCNVVRLISAICSVSIFSNAVFSFKPSCSLIALTSLRYQHLLDQLNCTDGKRCISSFLNVASLGNRTQMTFLSRCCPTSNLYLFRSNDIAHIEYYHTIYQRNKITDVFIQIQI